MVWLKGVIGALWFFWGAIVFAQPIVVGSKIFTENYLLAEIVSQLLEERGFDVQRKFGLGGTMVAFEGIRSDEIDLYPAYTGTVSRVIIGASENLTIEEINKRLDQENLQLLKPFGFNNTYALAVTEHFAHRHDLAKISDLAKVDAKIVFSFEFAERQDGWRGFAEAYGLQHLNVKSLEQALAYEAIGGGHADAIIIYTTEGKNERYGLKVLQDDLEYFPQYLATMMARKDLPERALRALDVLAGSLNEEQIGAMNTKIENREITYQAAATEFLIERNFIGQAQAKSSSSWGWLQQMLGRILRLSWTHLYLVFLATLFSTLIAVPVAVLLNRFKRVAKPVLYFVGLLQTIPTIALLVYMIPYFGVSATSALVAMFLYSLLPIVQNTYTGLQSVDPKLIKTAKGIGLYRYETLLRVELPLALPVIVAGIKTAAVINVGMATIAAFIGSGGLGELIVQGLTLNDIDLMQQGAIPAAIMAILISMGFSKIERFIERQQTGV